jgi:hypothetical protein
MKDSLLPQKKDVAQDYTFPCIIIWIVRLKPNGHTGKARTYSGLSCNDDE